MARFITVELVDASGTPSGARYINLDTVCRADVVNPTGERGKAIMNVYLADGFSFVAEGKLAEQLALAFAKHGDEPAKA